MHDAPALPRKTLLLIAAIQGLVLLFLKTATDGGAWPSQTPLVAYPLWTIAVSVPEFLLLSLAAGNERRVAGLVALFSVPIALAAIYTGSQARPFGAFPLANMTVIFAISTGVVCFKALMYIQQRGMRLAMTYDVLFTLSWRNALTAGLALAFTSVFWLILNLWASLFEVIGIGFFRRLFDMDWFLFVSLAVANATGIVLFRNLVGVIDSATRLLQGLLKLLLPLVTMITVLFLASLPFAGLDSLWDTGRGTALLLVLLGLQLFFVNAVYQDGRGPAPYPLVPHRLLYFGLCATPVLSALAFYGLYLRLAQYGWTVLRGWAFLVWFVLTLFAVGYTIGILRRRDAWTVDLARVNIGIGILVAAALLLVNSPLLDFRIISARSQLARIPAGAAGVRQFDIWYAHNALARPGHLTLEILKTRVGDSDSALLAELNHPVPAAAREGRFLPESLWLATRYRPAPFALPAGLAAAIEGDFAKDLRPRQVAGALQTVLARINLDEDSDFEYAAVLLLDDTFLAARIFDLEAGTWVSVAAYPAAGHNGYDDAALPGQLLDGAVSARPPRFDDLRFGDFVLRPGER